VTSLVMLGRYGTATDTDLLVASALEQPSVASVAIVQVARRRFLSMLKFRLLRRFPGGRRVSLPSAAVSPEDRDLPSMCSRAYRTSPWPTDSRAKNGDPWSSRSAWAQSCGLGSHIFGLFAVFAVLALGVTFGARALDPGASMSAGNVALGIVVTRSSPRSPRWRPRSSTSTCSPAGSKDRPFTPSSHDAPAEA
jgi:hypothetical protein